MWLILIIITIIAYAMGDIVGKNILNAGTETTPLEMLVSANILSFVVGMVLFFSGAGESGLAPWQIIGLHPMILVSFVCFVLYWLLVLFSLRYIDLSIAEAVSGASGVFFFIGLVVVNLVTRRLAQVGEMLHSWKLIPIILIVVFTVLLPNIEILANRSSAKSLTELRKKRKKTLIGLVLLLSGLAFDSVDSVVVATLFDGGKVGTVDYIMASYFLAPVSIILFSVIIFIKNKKVYIPFRSNGKRVLAYSLATLFSSFGYLFASSLDAVKTGIVFIAYPIIPLLGARLFLKETYTWRQNLCIWLIIISSIIFCAADYIG